VTWPDAWPRWRTAERQRNHERWRQQGIEDSRGGAALFLLLYYLPIEASRFQGAIIEAFKLAKWYAREHVLLCLVPAFFIAGAIGVFVSQNAVMKYFGPKAKKWLSYSVASVSGTILAVCSCTVLPLFGGIYMRGAGLRPAIAFPLLRACHQCAGDCADGACARLAGD
jgi:hypothetical protein